MPNNDLPPELPGTPSRANTLKKAYETTIEESVYAEYRLAELIGTVSREKRTGYIVAVFILVGAYSSTALKEDSSAPNVTVMTVAFVVAVIVLLCYLNLYPAIRRSRIRKIFIKAFGTDKPIPCEYEIDDSGITFRKQGQEIKMSCGTFRKLEYTEDSIELIMEPTAIAIFPRRIFRDPAELQEWISFIEGHTQSKGPV